MQTVDPQELEMSEAWPEGDATAERGEPPQGGFGIVPRLAGPDVTTTYETEVQPGGSRERGSTPS